MKKKVSIWVLILVLMLSLVPGAAAITNNGASDGEEQLESSSKADDFSEDNNASGAIGVPEKQPTEIETPAPSIAPMFTDDSTVEDTSEDTSSENGVVPEDGSTNIEINPQGGSKYGIIAVRQKNGEWSTTQEHYYSNSFLFVILCVVAVIIAIAIFILGIYFVNKIRR